LEFGANRATGRLEVSRSSPSIDTGLAYLSTGRGREEMDLAAVVAVHRAVTDHVAVPGASFVDLPGDVSVDRVRDIRRQDLRLENVSLISGANHVSLFD